MRVLPNLPCKAEFYEAPVEAGMILSLERFKGFPVLESLATGEPDYVWAAPRKEPKSVFSAPLHVDSESERKMKLHFSSLSRRWVLIMALSSQRDGKPDANGKWFITAGGALSDHFITYVKMFGG